MNDSKIQRLLVLSQRYTTIRHIIHACNLEYDREGADEYESRAAEIHEQGRLLRASMSEEEISEFERRLRANNV